MPGVSYPIIPGHEVIGTIDALGDGVSGFGEGERVGVGWNSGSCGYCRQCRLGNRFACENIQDVTGVFRDGGYATHVIARESALAKVPAELDSVAGAPLLCAGITTFNALRNCGASPGELVAVHGVGGLGHLALQYAAKMGFRVVAVNRGKDKEALARELGAHDYIDSTDGNPAEALQAMGGAKAIIATAVNQQAMEEIAPGIGPRGVMMVIGAVPQLTVQPFDLISKNGTVRGWYSGIAPETQEALEFSALADVASMNEVYPLADAQAAYDRMMSGKARFRVVLDCTKV
jgi:D-arabinose 1-dehydrogenase-like Zn-dependent alcohol dehydrogenase